MSFNTPYLKCSNDSVLQVLYHIEGDLFENEEGNKVLGKLRETSVPESKEKQTDVIVDEVKDETFEAQTRFKRRMGSVIFTLNHP